MGRPPQWCLRSETDEIAFRILVAAPASLGHIAAAAVIATAAVAEQTTTATAALVAPLMAPLMATTIATAVVIAAAARSGRTAATAIAAAATIATAEHRRQEAIRIRLRRDTQETYRQHGGNHATFHGEAPQ